MSPEVPAQPVRTYRQLLDEVAALERELTENSHLYLNRTDRALVEGQIQALRWAAGLDLKAPSASS